MMLIDRSLARCAAMVCLSVLATVSPAQDGVPVIERVPQIRELVDTGYPASFALYKDIHAHPELGFQEARTASLLAHEMRSLGFKVTEKVGKTGVVAIFENGIGPTVMVRTELDGLPMEEKTGLPYASKAKTVLDGRETYVAHSCGHDIHMAVWISTARALVAMKGEWRGTLMFVAQQGEEVAGGAAGMIADGLFTRWHKPDFALALHDRPEAYGTVGLNSGAISSFDTSVDIDFRGVGGHGSRPEETVDPILIAAHFITDVQSVVSREKGPFEFGVVTIGAVEAGTVGNIIPDHAILHGTIRSYKPEVRDKLMLGVQRTAKAAAMMAGAPEPEVSLQDEADSVVNDDDLVRRTEPLFKAVFGDANVRHPPPSNASEDFSVFVNQGIPSLYFFIGVYDPKRVLDSKKPGAAPLPGNHSPLFAPVPEPTIKTGALAMTVAVLNLMQRP
jgi:amidohydrolase